MKNGTAVAHAFFDQDLDDALVVRGDTDGEERYVDAERLVRERAALADLVAQRLSAAWRLRHRQGGDDAEPASVGHGSGHGGVAYVVHTALHDGVLDTAQIREFRVKTRHGLPFRLVNVRQCRETDCLCTWHVPCRNYSRSSYR